MHLIGKCSFLVVHTMGMCLTIDGILNLMTHDVLTNPRKTRVCVPLTTYTEMFIEVFCTTKAWK